MKNTKSKKPTLKQMTIKLGVSEQAKYTKENLIEILSDVSFELININLTTKKTNIGIDGLGYSSIGFINGFNPEECTFDVVVFENRVEAIEKLGDVVITARVFTNKDSKITKIIGLDVTPVVAE